MEVVALYMVRAFSGAGVPDAQRSVALAAASDQLPAVRREPAARHGAAVPREHLASGTGQAVSLPPGDQQLAGWSIKMGRNFSQRVARKVQSHAQRTQRCPWSIVSTAQHTHSSARVTCMHWPLSVFHIQAVKSSEPATSTAPRGCHCSQMMPSSGPSSVRRHAPVAASQIFTLPAGRLHLGGYC